MSLVAKVEILGEFKDLTRATQGATDSMKKMDKKFAGFSRSIKGSLALIASSMVFGELVSGIKSSIDAASDFAESATAVQEVFGTATDKVKDFASKSAEALGQSQNAALDGAKTFGIYGNAAGLAAEDSATFSTDLLTLASDLASFNNTSPEEAIAALGSGLRGEAEPLRKYGILLNDSKLKAAALKLGIYDGNGALDSQQKILAANAVIFDESATAQGDFARTSDGLANSTRIATAKMEDFQSKVGTALLPVMSELTDIFIEKLLPKLEEFADWLQSPEGSAFLEGVLATLETTLEVITAVIEGLANIANMSATTPEQVNAAIHSDPAARNALNFSGVQSTNNTTGQANINRFTGNFSTVGAGVPQMASGGVILPRAGGTLVNVGEAGSAEAIVPLDKAGIGGSNVYYININKASVNGQEVVRAIMDYEKTNGRKFVN